MIKRIYKDLYYDTQEGKYFFANKEGSHYIAEQQSYLLIYIIELLSGGRFNGTS